METDTKDTQKVRFTWIGAARVYGEPFEIADDPTAVVIGSDMQGNRSERLSLVPLRGWLDHIVPDGVDPEEFFNDYLLEQPWADTRVLACGHTDWDHAIGGDCEAILEGR
jgi:hypothetical protein